MAFTLGLGYAPYQPKQATYTKEVETIRFTCEQVKRYGLVPYAVYGGFVSSFKINENDEKAYDIELLPNILIEAHNRLTDN